MPLSDTAIRNAKPEKKQYKMSDGKGMYLLVTETGKYFRYDYRFNKSRKTLALGVYPDVSLKKARERLAEARRLLADGIDPSEYKKEANAKNRELASNSFEIVAMEWFVRQKHTWSTDYAKSTKRRLEKYVFPWLGSRPIAGISPSDLLKVLRKIESKGTLETAHRVHSLCGRVFRYAVITDRAERDPSADLRGAIAPVRSSRMATIVNPQKIGELLRSIDVYNGQFTTLCALRLAPLVFVRPGELRKAEWSEFDLDKAEWKISGDKMKNGLPHIVPLSRQAITTLNELYPLTGHGRYLFPNLRSDKRPMSSNAVNSALRNLGYKKDEICGHGFRAMASTTLHENSWPSDIIELQLSHVERNKVKAAYNHAQHMPKRRDMMQWWSDYLDKLKSK
ncbi:integrase arm-type DNA-binding domain-containing protein [Desulfogranum marinum]|uniref:tyrosine-type recombinase/integrase n=1 Tax=Desulfogranum marinum TaxID=453220 RepID=UPI0029C865E2|nr:integrase arm-type DNA-binding domain-containing protein [Desulfogranum marinum]